MAIISNKAILDSRPFATGIDQMTGKVRSFDKTLKGIKGSMGAMFAVGGITAFIKNALSTADEIDNMAKQAGLGVEAFQALQAAGKEAGISFETMRPPINALRRAIDKAKEGSEQQVEAFESLGISMSDLRNLKTEEVLAKVGAAMNRSEGNSEALVASTVVLGAESTRLQEIFKQLGEEGIDALIEKFKRLGYIIEKPIINSLNRHEEAISRLNAGYKKAAIEGFGAFVIGAEGIAAVVGRMSAGESFAEAWQGHIETLNGDVNKLNESLNKTAELTEEIADMSPSKAMIDYVNFIAERSENALPALEKLAMLEERLINQRDTAENYVQKDDYEERLRIAKLIAKTEDEIAALKKEQADLANDIVKKGMEFYNQGKNFGASLLENFFGEKQAVEATAEDPAYSSLRRIGGNLAGGMPKSESRQEKLIRQNEEQLRLQRQATQALISIEQQRGAVL